MVADPLVAVDGIVAKLSPYSELFSAAVPLFTTYCDMVKLLGLDPSGLDHIDVGLESVLAFHKVADVLHRYAKVRTLPSDSEPEKVRYVSAIVGVHSILSQAVQQIRDCEQVPRDVFGFLEKEVMDFCRSKASEHVRSEEEALHRALAASTMSDSTTVLLPDVDGPDDKAAQEVVNGLAKRSPAKSELLAGLASVVNDVDLASEIAILEAVDFCRISLAKLHVQCDRVVLHEFTLENFNRTLIFNQPLADALKVAKKATTSLDTLQAMPQEPSSLSTVWERTACCALAKQANARYAALLAKVESAVWTEQLEASRAFLGKIMYPDWKAHSIESPDREHIYKMVNAEGTGIAGFVVAKVQALLTAIKHFCNRESFQYAVEQSVLFSLVESEADEATME